MNFDQDLLLTECNKCGSLNSEKCRIPRFELNLIKVVTYWDSLIIHLDEFERSEKKYRTNWIFRGQLSRDQLKTSLERACETAPDVTNKDAPAIERTMMREFQRWYDGDDRDKVQNNELYCLSLMRHHYAPTRLLVWTYSPYVALYFELQYAHDSGHDYDNGKPFSIWCFNSTWCAEKAKAVNRQNTEVLNLIDKRGDEKERQEGTSFKDLYMNKDRNKFLLAENPYYFHERLTAQQGIFLCPGDISKSFSENLLPLINHEQQVVVKVNKLCCPWDKQTRQEALDKLRRMNIHRGVLFPDLDGFGQSLKYRLPFFKDLAEDLKNR
jgi:hypothetical protein